MLKIVGHWYDLHCYKFKDSRGQQLEEAAAHWRSVLANYSDALCVAETEIFDSLLDDENMQTSFRICRDLSINSIFGDA